MKTETSIMYVKICGNKTGAITLLLAFGIALSVHSQTTGFWRMEQDDNVGTGVSVTNLAGYNAMTLPNGNLDTGTDSVMTNRLANGLTNTASLVGGPNLSANVISYTNLNTDSITVEFFARSAENDAGFFTRSTASNGSDFGTNGVCIVDPNDLDIYYAVDDGAGGTTNVIWTSLHNSAGQWAHYAFTYDAPTGIGMFYINGVLQARHDGPDNRTLDWGSGTTDIKVGIGMDGGGPLISKGIFDELRVSSSALSPDQLLYFPDQLIARDSFWIFTNGLYGAYTENRVANNATNQYAVAGTIGFSVDNPWQSRDTSNIELKDDIDISHPLLADEMHGAFRLKAKDPRDQSRHLSVSVPSSPVYYMSALLRSQKIETNENMSMGFSDQNLNRNKGIHVGFNNGRLALFAGGTTYDLMTQNYELNITYLVVLRLTVNASGDDDKIEVYLAKEGDATIDRRVEILVDTFSSTTDLENLQFKIIAKNVSDDRKWWMDEPRLAVSAAALGIDPALLRIPPPYETLILIQ